MSNWQEIYQNKLTSAQEAAGLINCGDNILAHSALCHPQGLFQAMVERADLHDVTVSSLYVPAEYPIFTPEEAGRFRHISWFCSPFTRKLLQAGLAEQMPCFYGQYPQLVREYGDFAVFAAVVSPMDKHGYFSFGCAADIAMEAMAQGKKIILEVNPQMPRTFGQNLIHISQADLVFEAPCPLPEFSMRPFSEKDLAIGNLIAEMVPDEAIIQLGIGSIPDAVASCLKDKRDLGIHTELFTEAMLNLIEAGAVTNAKKPFDRYKSVTTFILGNRRVYDYIDNNPSVEFHPVDYTNDVQLLSQMPKLISINGCVQVDLWGQIASESIGPKLYSGSGGQVDFVRGAVQSPGGHSFIATYASAKEDTLSAIVPTLAPGSLVTTLRNDADKIVTEYGIAQLRGKTVRERALALINIAHPNFRAELTEQAKILKMI